MVSITRAGVSALPITAAKGRSSPELDAKVRTYRAQLADWVTCPSAKTPEGKAKIEQITTKLDSVKDQIKKSDVGGSQASNTTSPDSSDPAPPPNDGVAYLAAQERIGRNIDTYA